jgi:hypothetical protein
MNIVSPFMNDQELLSLNRKGLIPGPGEEEEAFSKRVHYCLNVLEHLRPVLGDQFTPVDEKKALEILNQAYPISIPLFDCAPDWIPLFFSNYKLTFWQGGCAWIFQVKEDSPTSAALQLRKKFLLSKTYLGIYNREELIAHELAHVGRLAFQEPKFEELIAYQTSRSRFRRWTGGMIQSTSEARLFILALFSGILGAFLTLWDILPQKDPLVIVLEAFPIVLVLLGLIRNIRYQRIFKKSLRNLQKVTGSEKSARATIFRLTDQEILDFSHFNPSQIRHYAEENRNSSLRWRVIYSAYFSS